MQGVLFWGVIITYSAAAAWVLFNQLRGVEKPCALSWWLVLTGWLMQLGPLVRRFLEEQGGVAVHLSASLALSALVMGMLYLVWWRLRRREARVVGTLLLPLMVISLLAAHFLPTVHPALYRVTAPLLIGHLALSLLAYALFSMAAILALMDAFQEHALKTKRMGRIFAILPPLDALEETLFLLVRMGFALLTASIVTGGLHAFEQYGTPLAFNHKQVLTWVTWVVFGVLLLGHHLYGWRGRRAVRYTLSGYLLLALAFLGVKFVTELILPR